MIPTLLDSHRNGLLGWVDIDHYAEPPSMEYRTPEGGTVKVSFTTLPGVRPMNALCIGIVTDFICNHKETSHG